VLSLFKTAAEGKHLTEELYLKWVL